MLILNCMQQHVSVKLGKGQRKIILVVVECCSKVVKCSTSSDRTIPQLMIDCLKVTGDRIIVKYERGILERLSHS